MNKKVLFICTHNSARSQMAEGLTNHFFPDVQAFSAGTEKTRVKPEAIEALKEIDIDISHHTSKTTEAFLNDQFDLVVTVCDSAKESCPFFPNAKLRAHAGFKDPSDITDPKERLLAFKRTRDEILDWLHDNLMDLLED